MTTVIDLTEIDVTIIKEMIGMSTVGLIITGTIHQEMIGGHTKVTNIMIIEGGMSIIDMTIIYTMMIEGVIQDPKDLDSLNIIQRARCSAENV